MNILMKAAPALGAGTATGLMTSEPLIAAVVTAVTALLEFFLRKKLGRING